ncbi:MAG: universal stress protein [Dehalococcoidia bacterium]|nr:universal stress protein [Dehalococcoidia bacterium]
MYKKMLVPLDTSGFAECVLEHVREIATTRGIPDVVLLSVIEPVTSQTMAYMGPQRIKESEERAVAGALQYLEKVKTSLALQQSKVSTAAVAGPAADAILDYAADNGVDVIVLSSHGRSGVTRVLMGSTADKVLRRSVVPVVLVPALSCRTHA